MYLSPTVVVTPAEPGKVPRDSLTLSKSQNEIKLLTA